MAFAEGSLQMHVALELQWVRALPAVVPRLRALLTALQAQIRLASSARAAAATRLERSECYFTMNQTNQIK